MIEREKKMAMAVASASTTLLAWSIPGSTSTSTTYFSSLRSGSSNFVASGSLACSRSAVRLIAEKSQSRGGLKKSSGGLGCRCIFGLGVPELVVIAGVAALVFGPKKLPEIGRGIGKTVKSFQQVVFY